MASFSINIEWLQVGGIGLAAGLLLGVLMTWAVILMARLHGLKIPFPKKTPLDEPLPVARALEKALREHGKAFMSTSVSKCVRIALAAQENGIDLTGLTFLGGSEPVTPAKYDSITASGARFYSIYATTETGHIGLPCLNPRDETAHLLAST